MTLLAIEGFDVGDISLKGFAIVHGGLGLPTTGRWSYDATGTPFGTGRSVKFTPTPTSSGGFQPSLTYAFTLAAAVKTYVGFWVRRGVPYSSANSADVPIWSAQSTSSTELTVSFNTASGVLKLWKGNAGGTLLATATAVLDLDTWTFLEIGWNVSSTTGFLTVRVNGTVVASFAGNTSFNSNFSSKFALLGDVSNQARSALWLDDLYFCSDAGTVNNGFLGPVRVQTLLPTGAGTDTHLAAVGAASNWAAEADNPYEPTHFVYGSTVGDRDTYALADLDPATTAVLGLRSTLIGAAGAGAVATLAAADAVTNAPDLSNAGALTSGSATWDNTLATTNEANEPLLLGYTNVVWHKVFVLAAGTLTLQHDTNDFGDTVLGLYSGPANATYAQLTPVNSDDDTAGNGKPRINVTVTANTWYYIASAGAAHVRYAGQHLHWWLGSVANAGIKPALRSAGTVYYDPTASLPALPSSALTIRESDPATAAAWTVAGVNALEAGAEVA